MSRAKWRVCGLISRSWTELPSLWWNAVTKKREYLTGAGKELRPLEVAPLVYPEVGRKVVLKEEALVVDADAHELHRESRDD